MYIYIYIYIYVCIYIYIYIYNIKRKRDRAHPKRALIFNRYDFLLRNVAALNGLGTFPIVYVYIYLQRERAHPKLFFNRYESLLRNVASLNGLGAFPPLLAARMDESGFKLLRVVYRGYSTSEQVACYMCVHLYTTIYR